VQSNTLVPHMQPTFTFVCDNSKESIVLSPVCSYDFRQLASVHYTFANIPLWLSPIDECPLYFPQQIAGLSPLAKVQLAKVLLAKFRNPAQAVCETAKNFHLNTLLFSKNNHFSFQSLFVYILRIRYLWNKGARRRILLRFFILHWGLSIAKRWDLKGLNT
jgi:hypothetical protein